MKMLKVEVNHGGMPEQVPTPASEYLDMSATRLVFNYLAHNCYAETTGAFMSQWSASSTQDLDQAFLLNTLEYRKTLRTFVLEGKMAEAIAYIEEFFPQLLSPDMQDGADEEGIWLRFKLLCQQFVELVRSGDSTNALEFIETDLSSIAQSRPRLVEHLQNVVVLLAYTNPMESPVRHLLSIKYREELADLVNAAILKQTESSLETFLRQSIVVNSALGSSSHLVPSQSTDSKSALSLDLAGFMHETAGSA